MQVLNSLCDKFVRLCGKDNFIVVWSSVAITDFQVPSDPVFYIMTKSAVQTFSSLQRSASTEVNSQPIVQIWPKTVQ